MKNLDSRLAALERFCSGPAIDVRDMTDAQLWAVLKTIPGCPDMSTASDAEIDAFLLDGINGGNK